VIVVDNASVDETPYYLKTLASQEKRLVVRVLESNRGYAAGAAEGMRLAKGKFVIFLNPDTKVFGPWVERLLEPMLKDPDVAASGPVSNYAAGLQNVGLYADIKGRTGQVAVEQIRQELDAQWQGKLVDTKLLIGFCLVVRREALEKIGGLDEALYLGNDDLDLSWRLQQAGYKQVVVPSVFVYHQGQASFNTEPKVRTKYLVQQSTNQLYEKLYAAYGGKVPSGQELWDISWFTPQRELLSIVIPVHKDPEATRQCLESIVRHTHRPYEIIVVDNAADNETKGVLKEFAQRLGNLIVITNDANLGYPRACNQGIEAATGEYIAVMNNDVIVTPYWASRLLAAFAVDPQVGAVGPRTNYAVGPQRVETANYTLAQLDHWAAGWHRDHAGNLTPTGRLIGFLVVLKRKLVDDIGGFDPLFGVGNFEDDDLSLRALLKGYKLVIAEDVFIHHHGSRSFGSIPQKYLRLMDTNGKLFAAKWGVRLDKGAYSPGDVLNQRGRYGRAELYIPLSFESMFAPDVEALDVGTGAPNRFLCVPDPSDPLESWLDLFRNYFAAFGDGGATAESATSASQAPTMHQNTASGAEQETQGQIAGGERPSQALIIRAEPAEQSWVDRLVDGLKSVAKEIDIDLDKRDDLVVEARSIPSAMRGQVYRAATVFVPLPGVRRESLVREAEACGLRVLSGYTPQDLVGAVLGGATAETREAEAVR
jgi:GT2 family glycosyltransferase